MKLEDLFFVEKLTVEMSEVDGSIVILVKTIFTNVNADFVGAVEVQNGQDGDGVAHTSSGERSSVRDAVNLQFNKGSLAVGGLSSVAHALEAELVNTGSLDSEGTRFQVDQMLGISVDVIVVDDAVGRSSLGVGMVDGEDVSVIVLFLDVSQLGVHF